MNSVNYGKQNGLNVINQKSRNKRLFTWKTVALICVINGKCSLDQFWMDSVPSIPPTFLPTNSNPFTHPYTIFTSIFFIPSRKFMDRIFFCTYWTFEFEGETIVQILRWHNIFATLCIQLKCLIHYVHIYYMHVEIIFSIWMPHKCCSCYEFALFLSCIMSTFQYHHELFFLSSFPSVCRRFTVLHSDYFVMNWLKFM